MFEWLSDLHLYPDSCLRPVSACQACFRSPWPDLLPYSKLQNHLTILILDVHKNYKCALVFSKSV